MPIFVYLDSVFFILLACRAHALLVSVLQNILTVRVVDCIQNIEEVRSVTVFALWKTVRHERHKFWVFAQLRPKFGHRKFIVRTNVDVLDFVHLQESFFAGEN